MPRRDLVCCICGAAGYRLVAIRTSRGREIGSAAYCDRHWHQLRVLLAELETRLNRPAPDDSGAGRLLEEA